MNFSFASESDEDWAAVNAGQLRCGCRRLGGDSWRTPRDVAVPPAWVHDGNPRHVGGPTTNAGGWASIHAAAGSVGHLAVQIAKAYGAYVIDTARADQHELLAEGRGGRGHRLHPAGRRPDRPRRGRRARPRRRRDRHAVAADAARRLRVRVAKTFPLEQAARAQSSARAAGPRAASSCSRSTDTHHSPGSLSALTSRALPPRRGLAAA
jgi:hypothetical protein